MAGRRFIQKLRPALPAMWLVTIVAGAARGAHRTGAQIDPAVTFRQAEIIRIGDRP